MRIGIGYDVHRLISGRPLIIGGVTVPSDKGLDGHSDADVLVHAIADALLGAAALGDIGVHFPDTDMKYQGISSIVLLHHVAGLLRTNNLTVHNVDATLILQQPKIRPYVDEMRENIAKALELPITCVSIKATTNEGLGFIGAGEGAAAHAVALLQEVTSL